MSKNDEKILKLKESIESKKSKVEKAKRFAPETNCLVWLDDKNYNLNALDEEALTLLLVKLNVLRMSAENLLLDLDISGYNITTWISDIKQKLSIIKQKRDLKELKDLEDKLDKLLSSDKKTELEINAIADMLK